MSAGAGVASTSMSDAVAQTKACERLGADGILAIFEACFPLQDAQVESCFRAIADAVDIPVAIYTNPQFQRSDCGRSPSPAVQEGLACSLPFR